MNDNLFIEIVGVIENGGEKREKLQAICKLLKGNLKNYDWVGFYLVDESGKNLNLGPFVGAPTEHVKIAFGQGICGQAAETKKTFVVDDVSKESNYLSCSINVRSEIVIPIFKEAKIVGELDIDSHVQSAFKKEDKDFLEKVCSLISKIF